MIQLPPMLTLILGSLALITSILYIREYFLRKKGSKEAQNISIQTKQKSIELLNAAQLAQTHILTEGNYATQKLVSEFKTQLQTITGVAQKDITASTSQLIKFMEDLQKRSLDFEEASRVSTEKRINELFERLETKLSDFLVATESKTASSIELELKAARELIETYKTAQLKLIDENVVAMMEQTINIVLGKKLSLKDQLDLIYEALEKAKIEKFIV